MRKFAWVLGIAVACSTSHKSASDTSAGASTSKEDLAKRGLAALRAGNASAYAALVPDAKVLPDSCSWSAKYLRVRKNVIDSLDQHITECQRLIDWANARVTPRRYQNEPRPDSKKGCQQVIVHDDATFDVSVGDKRYQVTVEDVMEVRGRFYTLDYPQCRQVEAR